MVGLGSGIEISVRWSNADRIRFGCIMVLSSLSFLMFIPVFYIVRIFAKDSNVKVIHIYYTLGVICNNRLILVVLLDSVSDRQGYVLCLCHTIYPTHSSDSLFYQLARTQAFPPQCLTSLELGLPSLERQGVEFGCRHFNLLRDLNVTICFITGEVYIVCFPMVSDSQG